MTSLMGSDKILLKKPPGKLDGPVSKACSKRHAKARSYRPKICCSLGKTEFLVCLGKYSVLAEVFLVGRNGHFVPMVSFPTNSI